ncbi:MAG: multiple sugar transport system permease protein [Candidatus Atribacteria bacterium]|nr:multiple sugar transport system permease protein [Candidatus Atribacteria bacterium]
MEHKKRTPLKEQGKTFFIAPAVIWLLTFTIIPLIYTVYLSFHSSRFLQVTGFVGFQNYIDTLTDYRFWSAFRVTITFVVFSVLITVGLGLLLALLFNRQMRGIKFFRTICTTPLFTAPVALGYMFMIILYEEGGPINNFLQALGLNSVSWLSDARWAVVSVLIADTWQWTPFVFLVLLAAMQALPRELYEAASLDTSSGWGIFQHITLPLISPALGTVSILRTVEAFKIFDLPFALTNGGPGLATRTLTFNVYTNGLRDQDLGSATATAVILLVMVLVVSLIFFRRYGSNYD